jgi:hypothetical protein
MGDRPIVGLCLSLAAAAFACSLTPACADGVLRLSYVEVHDRILPSANVTSTSVNVVLHLRSDGGLEHLEDRASGSARGGTKSSLRLGADAPRSWHVAGPHQLVSVQEYFTYKRAIQVNVDGDRCTANIGYALNSGATDYQYPRLKTGERATARSVKASNVTCSIQAQ